MSSLDRRRFLLSGAALGLGALVGELLPLRPAHAAGVSIPSASR